MKKILWLTESWSFDTDKEIVPYLMETKAFDIKWMVFAREGKVDVPESNLYELKVRPYISIDIRTFFYYYNILKKAFKEKYDLVYSSFSGFPFYYPVLYLEKPSEVPVIYAAHAVIPLSTWTLLTKMMIKVRFSLINHFQMFSKHTARYFHEHYPNKSYFYAPMVIKNFGEVKTDNYKVDVSKVNLLFFGGIASNKRLPMLIDAIKQLPEEVRKKVHLNVCGKCKEDMQGHEDDFMRQIGDCDAITCYFKRIPDEEIPELFTKHQFLVLPYQNVSQSGPHMIAYYYNLPVIVSDTDGLAERVVNEKNGFVFKRDDEDALIKTLIKAISMSREDYCLMKENLKQYSNDNFSKEVVSKKYIEYFNSIK